MGQFEQAFVREAFASNWLSTVGPNIDAFDREFSEYIGLPSVAVSSGTAAIHLGLRLLGVNTGDAVICQSLTFVASVNPVLYQGARPVFLDSERMTWNLDPQLLRDVLKAKARLNKLPRAVIVVHLFGQCAEIDSIISTCGEYNIPVLEDAAEALGASYRERPAGTWGDVAAFSFNGNKIITTTGGGALVCRRKEWVDKAKFWASQARDTGRAYEHSQTGYNYRLSNVLAGIGRGQLRVLDLRVTQRRAVARRYELGLADVPGLEIMPESPLGRSTRWLTTYLVDESKFGFSRDQLIAYLDDCNIEARPVWKPMHLQRVFQGFEHHGGHVAEDLFHRGICLPSSSNLDTDDQSAVINAIRALAGRAKHAPALRGAR